MKDSELLRKAKEILHMSGPDNTKGICRAINMVTGRWNDPQAMSLNNWVGHMLGSKSAYLTGWLYDEKLITLTELQVGFHQASREGEKLRAKLHQTRLNWIDWMIEQCEKEEQQCASNQ